MLKARRAGFNTGILSESAPRFVGNKRFDLVGSAAAACLRNFQTSNPKASVVRGKNDDNYIDCSLLVIIHLDAPHIYC